MYILDIHKQTNTQIYVCIIYNENLKSEFEKYRTDISLKFN